MPAALVAAKLTDLKPTAEEVEKAKQARQDATASKRRSQDTGFKDYVKKHAELNPDMTTAEVKEACLLNFLVLQLRSKGGKASLTGVHEAVTRSAKIAEKHWWNEFQMDSKLGVKVGKHWRDSKLLQRRPCPVTGSELDEHAVYGVPKLWESLCEEDLKLLRLETQREAQAGDLEAVAEFSALTKDGIKDGGDQTEDKGPLTPKQAQEAFQEDLTKSPATYLRKYQDWQCEGP